MTTTALAPHHVRQSLMLVEGGSPDVTALARVLARATDGTVLRSVDPVGESIRSGHPGLVVVGALPPRAAYGDLDALVLGAPCPVAVAPRGYARRAPTALRRVGVAFDGWEESRGALAEAMAIAMGSRADVCVLTVRDPRAAASARSSSHLHGLAESLPPGVHARHRILDGPVAPALADTARTEKLDLLVLGSRRRGTFGRVALGSVSHALLGDPPCAVLVCPRGMAPARETAAPRVARDWSLGAVLAERAIDPRTYLLVVRADAGLAAALDLRRRLLGLRLAGHTTVLVDLEGAHTVSDAILAALMQARRQLAARDGRLVVTSEDPAVCAAAEQVGLELVDGLEGE